MNIRMVVFSALFALSLGIQSAVQWPTEWTSDIPSKDEPRYKQALEDALTFAKNPLLANANTTKLTAIKTDQKGLIWSKSIDKKSKYVLMTSWIPEAVIQGEWKDKAGNQISLLPSLISDYPAADGRWRRLYSKTPGNVVPGNIPMESDDPRVSRDRRIFWVTPANETFQFVKNYNLLAEKDPTKPPLWMRMTQLLGLNAYQVPTASKRAFVEMWVKPEDLIRPCMDASPITKGCTLPPQYQQLKADEFAGAVKNLENKQKDPEKKKHLEWYAEQKNAVAAPYKMPFIGLGYTYDWGDPADRVRKNLIPHQGASEYLIREGATVYLHRIVPGFLYGNTKKGPEYKFGRDILTPDEAKDIKPDREPGPGTKEVMPLWK